MNMHWETRLESREIFQGRILRLTVDRVELEEECGLMADTVTELGCIYPSVGYDDEIIHLYLATGLRRTAPNPDSGEFLTLETRSLEELRDMAMAGTLRDAKTVAAVLKTVLLRSESRE